MNTLSRQTKIVATIGPASMKDGMLEKMIEAGMNVARINFSHGDHEGHGKEIQAVREAAKRVGKSVAIMQDLCGPKIRIGDFVEGQITLVEGEQFTITTRKVAGTAKIVSVNYAPLPKYLKPGNIIKIEDGKYSLKVLRVKGEDIVTEILVGGTIRSRRGVNTPGADMPLNVLPAKDLKDLAFGLAQGVDYVALSFVQTEADVKKLKKLIAKAGSYTQVIAKIETQSAMSRIQAIVDEADAVMIARGDLAVEIDKEDVPLAQKQIIRLANEAGKLAITATQMLDSMTSHPEPTRAEVNDVANAIFDGTDAVMLSAESAVGINPARAIQTMADIALRTEASQLYRDAMNRRNLPVAGKVDAVTTSVAGIAQMTDAKVIVALTESGFTPYMVARHRPKVSILSLTPHEGTARQLQLAYGCMPLVYPDFSNTNDAITASRKLILEQKLAKKGDTFILVAGIPYGQKGSTNSILVLDV